MYTFYIKKYACICICIYNMYMYMYICVAYNECNQVFCLCQQSTFENLKLWRIIQLFFNSDNKEVQYNDSKTVFKYFYWVL